MMICTPSIILSSCFQLPPASSCFLLISLILSWLLCVCLCVYTCTGFCVATYNFDMFTITTAMSNPKDSECFTALRPSSCSCSLSVPPPWCFVDPADGMERKLQVSCLRRRTHPLLVLWPARTLWVNHCSLQTNVSLTEAEAVRPQAVRTFRNELKQDYRRTSGS